MHHKSLRPGNHWEIETGVYVIARCPRYRAMRLAILGQPILEERDLTQLNMNDLAYILKSDFMLIKQQSRIKKGFRTKHQTPRCLSRWKMRPSVSRSYLANGIGKQQLNNYFYTKTSQDVSVRAKTYQLMTVRNIIHQ